MTARKINYFVNIFLLLLVVLLAYYFRANLSLAWQKLEHTVRPCQKPLTYHINHLDERFGLSREDFLIEIQGAEKIWEQAIGRDLFRYALDGQIAINLVYDARQKATDDLKDVGVVIKNDQNTFETIKVRYEEMLLSYQEAKAKLDILLESHQKASSSYEQDLERVNLEGGATKNEAIIFEKRRTELNNQVILINKEKSALNVLVEAINSTSVLLNNLIASLNLKIDNYNTIGASNGEQFNEGEYIVNASQNIINIYQFSNRSELVSVLAHELGHALGMEHLDNKQAIMYYLNESGGEKLTEDDIAELRRVCRIR